MLISSMKTLKIRKFVKAKLFDSGISSVIIERTGVTKVKITVHTAKPGIVIGRQGAAIEVLRGELKKMTGKDVFINVI